MPSLSECLGKAGDLLAPELRDAILARAAELRESGMTTAGASRQAVADVLADAQMRRAEVEAAAADGRALYAERPQQEEGDATGNRLDRMAQDMPDMRVILPGKTELQRLSEALEAARAEAAEDASFADLVKVAAECALNFN